MNRHTLNRATPLRLFLAAELALLFYILISRATYAAYASLEDVYIMYALAGRFTGQAAAWVPGLSPLLSRPLAMLYAAHPSVNFYPGLQRLLLALDLVVVNACLLRQFRRWLPRREYLPGLLLGAALDALLCWTLARMDRLGVAAVTGAAALCALLTGDYRERGFALRGLGILALAFFSVGFAPEAGLPLLGFTVLATVLRAAPPARLRAHRGRVLRRAVALALLLGVLTVGSPALYRHERDRLCGAGYGQWEEARSAYADHDPAAYADAAAAYASAGWSEDFAELARRGYALDERFNAEAISQVLEQAERPALTSPAAWASALRVGPGSADAHRQTLGLVIALAGLLAAGLALALGVPGRLGSVLAALASVLWTAALCAVSLLRGRLSLAVFATAALPCAAFLAVCLADNAGARFKAAPRGGHSGPANLVALLVALILLGGSGCLYQLQSLAYLNNAENRGDFERTQAKARVLEDYAAGRRDQLLLADPAETASRELFPSMAPGDLSNVLYWGGPGTNSRTQVEQLQLDGLAAPFAPEGFASAGVGFVGASEDDFRLLLRHLGAEYGLRVCLFNEQLHEGLWAVQFAPTLVSAEAQAADGAPLRILAYDGAEVVEFTPGQGSGAAAASADAFTVSYHGSDGAQADAVITSVASRTPTALRTCESLGFLRDDRLFAGWRAYRSDTHCWRVVNRFGMPMWARSVPEGGSYYLYPDGAQLSLRTKPGAELHLYAQWNSYYTVLYHRYSFTRAGEEKTEVVYGQPTPLKTYDELGYSSANMTFKGWRAMRESDRCWLVVNGKGETSWAEKPPADGDYYLYDYASTMSTSVLPGETLHLYGQWDYVKAFTVRYHLDDDAPASATVTTVELNKSSKFQTLKPDALGFSIAGKRFVGWRAYRTDTQCWRVLTAKGKGVWAETPPEGGGYALFESGVRLGRNLASGSDLHLYAQWERAEDYTVYYHFFDGADADPRTTSVRRGETVYTLSVQELGFALEGYRFKGWKAYRTDNRSWRVTDKFGARSWMEALPDGAEYYLYKDGVKAPNGPKPGSELHFYAQWAADGQ